MAKTEKETNDNRSQAADAARSSHPEPSGRARATTASSASRRSFGQERESDASKAGNVDDLRENSAEVDPLFHDLPTGVTAFFRDPKAFKALAERALPELVGRATPERPIRVWVPACASGEEAYSIAMLLIEQFRDAGKTPSLQMFASDIDERALEIARQGVYGDSIAGALSRERLRRFFVKIDAHRYQVNESLRESIVFASQNLIGDAPFSKLDLISCRNFLIHLEPGTQDNVISLLRFALNDDGYLLLGPSESIGRTAGLFATVSRKWRLFRRTGPTRHDLVTVPIAAESPLYSERLAPDRARRPPTALTMNEELESPTAELESSIRELQSLNEELVTVNRELRRRVEDRDAANSDLDNLMAAADIATVFLDKELRIKRFTPPTARLFNLLAADVGRPIRELAPRFTDNELLRDAERVLETLTPREKEIRTDQGHCYLRRILPYRGADDHIGGVAITFIDITARIEAETQVRRLAAVLRDSNDAVILSAPDGRITAWNSGAARAYGYSEAEALEMNVRDIIPETHRKSVVEIAARLRCGEEIEPFESRRTTRDGRLLDVWVTLIALKDDNGRVTAIARTERDVTARRLAEAQIRKLNAELEQRVAQRTAELEDSEQRIRAILGATVDAIVTIDAEGTIGTFNTAAETMFGYAADEVVGRNISLLMASPYREQHDEYLKRYLRTRERRVIGRLREFRARHKNGTEFPVQLSVSEITDLGLYTGIVRDMTEQRRLQEEIVRIATMEQRRIGEELHDTTQQELTGLGLLAQNLADSLREHDAAHEQGLAAQLASGIASTNRHVRSLAQGLVPVPVDAEGLMLAIANLARRTEEEHDLSCRFICPEPVRIADDGIAQHMYRIAQEAVTNAIKHAEAETITIRLEYADGNLRIDIRDDGIGIETDGADRDGLGLRIMEHRCGLMGGTFSVRPRKQGGTLVSCKVPVIRAE